MLKRSAWNRAGGQVARRERLAALWRLTLPSVRWALAYGVVLTLARSLGEFGAVRVVAGNVLGSTQTMPLLASALQRPRRAGAYAISFVMVSVAIRIIVVAILRPKERRADLGIQA